MAWTKKLLPMALTIGCGLLLYKVALPRTVETVWAVPVKLRGKAPGCSWGRIFSITSDIMRFGELRKALKPQMSVTDYDPTLDIERISSPQRAFWIPRKRTAGNGENLLNYLLAEQDWVLERAGENAVRRGDIVLDCGGHVGTFTHKALELGAAKVITIEPNPVLLECLRRNFPAEIAAGRVILAPKGVWSSEKSMVLHLGVENSGMGSLVHDEGGRQVEVPVTTIDVLVRELGLPRVDSIKMDIEGAEREALQGGMQTLRRHRPRLMLDSYHEPDDMTVLPGIIRQAHADYKVTCGPCQPRSEDPKILVPHTTFYQ